MASGPSVDDTLTPGDDDVTAVGMCIECKSGRCIAVTHELFNDFLKK